MSFGKMLSTRPAAVAAACALALAAGCGGAKSGRLVDYLDELEFDVPLETAAYVTLGRFDIPIAASHDTAPLSKFMQQVDERGTVWMRLQFELTAETTPQHENAVAKAAEEHQGALNDAVLTIVRTSTVEELADPRLTAVHARISEAVQPLLGDGRVRQLVFNDPQSVAERQRREEEEKARSHGGGHGAEHGGGHGDEHTGHGQEGHAEHGHGEDQHGDAGHEHDEHGSEDHGHH
jgi:hypothetical protein